ncbi:MAG TPA: DNA/RNA non-specific endonuclease, partial [Chitinophaga sp.]
DPASTEIQAAVRVLIQKINSEDTTPIAENEISTLRGLLLKHKGVSSLFTQEDGGELMMFMLGLMLDVTGKDLDLPKEKEDDAEATIIAANNKPGAIAAVHKTSLERLVRKNPVLKDHQVTVTRRERVIKKNLAEPSTLPDLFRNNAAVKTQWEEESEPLGNVIPVDIGETSDFEEFLFQRYGKGWETENFSTDNHAKYTMDVNGQKRNVAFKSRQKQYRFSNLPPTLSFLVKRFTGDKSSQKKEMRNYALPPQLILVEISGGDQKRYKHYELKGIVVHTGDSINKGHYYTHRKEGKDWVKANDRNVWKEDSPGADLQQGYIYTYQLKYESDALQPGQQAPQEKYDLPATIYLADSKLRPTDAMGFATDPKHRNTQAQSAVSGEINDIIKAFFPETEGVYHAGHLFTSTLGGTGDARNLTPMWDNYNSGSGGYKDFEDKRLTGLLNEAKENQRLYIAIHATYPADDTPEQVFQGLLSTEDIALLVAWYTKGVPVYNKKLAAATTPEEKQEFRKKLEIAKGVQNFYPHFIRVCRRIPLQMYNREARLITVEGSGAFLSRGPNQRFNISGSPRHMLGALDLDYFIDEREESLAPYTRLYGGQQSIDLKGQDPDEWAVKTYADMPEPGVFNYITIDGRAAGVDAYIWMDPEGIFSTYKFGGGTEDAGPAPEGFDWRLLNQARRHGKTKLYARAHLLNGKLHGSGNDPKNLSPFTQDANKKMSKEFEEKVKQLPALTTPGKGIFWVSRLTGTVKRSGLFNTKLAEKQAALPLTTDRWKKDSLEMQIALAEEEARMFGGIHFFAYEADVQKDGSLKKGKLLLSAYFENCFSGESGTLGDTSYNSLFAKREKGAALLQLGFSSEREALKNLSAAIGEEHKNANETYIKSAPAMAKDSPAFKFETAANDIQATLNEQLPLYYAAYQTHLKNLADVTNWNKQIATFNRKVAGLANLPAKTWQVAYDEVIDSGKELKKTVSGYGKCLAHYLQLVEWYKSLKLMAVQHHLLTGKVADYSAIKKTKLTTLKDLKPAKLRKLTSIRTPKTRETTPDASPRPKKKAKKDTGSSDKSK